MNLHPHMQYGPWGKVLKGQKKAVQHSPTEVVVIAMMMEVVMILVVLPIAPLSHSLANHSQ
jgi:hypothetical protein